MAVYFRDSETQAQLLNFRELGRKVRARLLAQLCGVHPHRGTGTRVRYAREDQVTMICDLFPANNEPGTGIDATETETDDHGGCSLALLGQPVTRELQSRSQITDR